MKDLEKIRKESREIKDKIDDTEERLRQLKNQEKKKYGNKFKQWSIRESVTIKRDSIMTTFFKDL